MNLETKITIYKFTPQLFTLTPELQRVIFLLIIFNKQILLYSCLYHKKDVYLSYGKR